MRQLLLGSTGLAVLAAQGAHAEAQQSDALETVIVTAEKQATDIQKTSVSVTAIQLDGMPEDGKVKLTDLLGNVAGVALQSQSRGNTIPVIRGIVVSQGEAVVSQVDGVPTIRTSLQYLGMFDVNRIEVLRGPQGTLYGRNAEIGAVNLYTNDPTDKYDGAITVGGGDYNLVQSDGYINIPLADDLAMRVAFSGVQRTGYGHPEGTGNDDYQSMRGKIQYKPSENERLLLTGAFTNFNFFGTYDIQPPTVRAQNFASPAFGGFNPCGGNPDVHANDPFHTPPVYSLAVPCTVPAQPPVNPSPVTGVCQRVQRSEENYARVRLENDYDLGWSSIYLMASHDNDHFPINHISQGSTNGLNSANWNPYYANVAEARLSSEAGQDWRWVAGVYWEQTHEDQERFNKNGLFSDDSSSTSPRPATDASVHSGMFALYGQTTVPITDRFRVIGGLRYAIDHLDIQQLSINAESHSLIIGAPANGAFRWPRLKYKAGIEYDIADQSMFFANVSTGFRQAQVAAYLYCVSKTTGATVEPLAATSGGGCPTGSSTATTFTSSVPDNITNYEAGIKNRFFDNKVQADIDVFDYDLKDFGNTGFGVDGTNRAASQIVSIKGSKGYGSELETNWLITPNDRLDVALAYLVTEVGPDNPFDTPVCQNFGASSHATINITPTIDPVKLVPVINTVNFAACSAKNLAANPATVNWVRLRPALKTGDPFSNAPTWNGNITYQHIFDLSSGASVTTKIVEHFQSKTNANIAPFYDGVNPAFHMTDMQVEYDTADGKWSLSAWAKNLENHLWIQGAGQSGIDYVYDFIGAPRTWGVTLNAKF
jgi:iron complex outermembrane receptor protein